MERRIYKPEPGEDLSASVALGRVQTWLETEPQEPLDLKDVIDDITYAIGYLEHAQRAVIDEINKAFKELRTRLPR